jgi:uncharacterized protein
MSTDEKNLPTHDAIVNLHKKYAPNEDAFKKVFSHCQIVAEIAMELLKAKPMPDIDVEFVKTACLIHDIGVYELFDGDSLRKDDYILHGIKGQRILHDEGFDEALCRIASHHTGVGIDKRHIIEHNLDMPHEDFHAETPEERLVMYADKFHSKTPRFNKSETYARFVSRYGEGKAEEFKKLIDEFGLPDLEHLSKKYSQPLI